MLLDSNIPHLKVWVVAIYEENHRCKSSNKFLAYYSCKLFPRNTNHLKWRVEGEKEEEVCRWILHFNYSKCSELKMLFEVVTRQVLSWRRNRGNKSLSFFLTKINFVLPSLINLDIVCKKERFPLFLSTFIYLVVSGWYSRCRND